MTDADTIRAATQRIIQRYYGHLPDAVASIRLADVQRIDAYVEAAEDRAARCTCEPGKGFEINTRRDKPVHAMFLARRLGRMRAEDAAWAL